MLRSRLGLASGPALDKLLPTPAHSASTTHSDTSTSCRNGVGSGGAKTEIPRCHCGEVLTKADSTAVASGKWNGNLEPWATRDALRYLEALAPSAGHF